MAKNIKRTILSEKSPRNRHIAWAEPKGESIQLNIFNDGKWRPVGGGSSTTITNKYTSDPNAPMLSKDNISTQMNIIAEKLDIDLVRANPEQMEQIFNELKSVKFATPKQGNAVLVDYDLDNKSLTFQCDDGSIITPTNKGGMVGLRPDIDGYIIWKTTKDKLPVRESQEEINPDKPNPGGNITRSVKPGPSLKRSGSEIVDQEEVYTVINNNTGEIVDPLELHKLTNVIWYNYYGSYYPFYLNIATDINNLPPVFQSMDLNQIQISVWIRTNYGPSTFSYLSVSLYYDYTLKPISMSRINTTDHLEVSNIDAFFNY